MTKWPTTLLYWCIFNDVQPISQTWKRNLKHWNLLLRVLWQWFAFLSLPTSLSWTYFFLKIYISLQWCCILTLQFGTINTKKKFDCKEYLEIYSKNQCMQLNSQNFELKRYLFIQFKWSWIIHYFPSAMNNGNYRLFLNNLIFVYYLLTIPTYNILAPPKK